MPHRVDGFDLTFTSRTSWKAKRSRLGKVVDIVPVTWTKGHRRNPQSGDIFQEVWFQDKAEMDARSQSREPMVVAVAVAKDYSKLPHEFDEFRALFEVVPTGRTLSDHSIETRVLRRVEAK